MNEPIAFHMTQDPISSPDVAPRLGATSGGNGIMEAVAFSENQRAELVESSYAHQLTTGGGKPGQGYPAVRSGVRVRRLTPVECERLMGWSDNHTAFRVDGSKVSDSTRYRMCGNGVVASQFQGIAERITAILAEDR